MRNTETGKKRSGSGWFFVGLALMFGIGGGMPTWGAGGDNTGPKAVSPHNSLSQTPELRWTFVEGAARYTVSIQKDFGEAPFFTKDVTGTSLTVSKALDRGKTYIWKVEAR